MEALAAAGRPLTPTELNRAIGLPKPTIHRLCQMMVEEGFLQREPVSNRLKPARRARAMSSGLLAASQSHIARHQILRALSLEIGETCNIAVPETEGMVYVDRVETQWPMRIQLPIGTHVPFHCTASGKMFLSRFAGAELDRMLDSLELKQHASNTITEREKLASEILKIRKRGFSEDNEEFMDGLVALSVPIRDPNAHQFATVAFHAPSSRMPLSKVRTHRKTLEAAAQKLSAVIFQPEGQ